MNFLKNIFNKKDDQIKTTEDFWNWFQNNAKTFFKVVNDKENIEKVFFDKLSPKLNQLNDELFFLAGMFDDQTAELVITPEGSIKNIAFVEDLVASAPKIDGWKFTALKPALDITDVGIEMAGYKFGQDNMSFYSNELSEYPDEIDITVVHNDLNAENKTAIINGTYIFMDNYIGELNFVTTIDNLTVIGKDEINKDLVPMAKLKDFLIWRQKEFIEKYEGLRYDTEKDNYSGLEAQLKNGSKLFAVINRDLLEWDRKASHPWILNIEIKYDGKNTNGMPDEDTYQLLNEIEDKITEELKDFEGYLNVGRQTADSVREIYFACKDFRKPSKVLNKILENYSDRIDVDYDIYKDKYWKSFNRYRTT